MQNKRGISQAFAAPAALLEIRRATVFDVFAMSRVLASSIRGLCAADHGNDPVQIDTWLENKTPEQIRLWFRGPEEYWLAEQSGQAAAVGAILLTGQAQGRITLNHVDPAFRFQRVSSRMLSHLEGRLLDAGADTGLVTSTATARSFYLSRGWQPDGAPRQDRWIKGHPLCKQLS